MALIHDRFGFTSSWFALTAPVNPVGLELRAVAVVTGFAFLLAIWHLIIAMTHISRHSGRRSDWFIAIVLLAIVLACVGVDHFSSLLVSPSPDIPVILAIQVSAWLMLLLSQTETGGRSNSRLLPLVMAAGAVSVKLNALPLLPIAVLFYGVGGAILPRLALGSAIALGLLLPALSFGPIASGCPLYPSALLCFDLPWSIRLETASERSAEVQGWGTWFGKIPEDRNPVLWLFWQWFQLYEVNQVLILCLVVAIAGLIYTWKVAKVRIPLLYLWQLSLGLLGTIFIFAFGPLARFGLGYFILIPAILISNYLYETWGDRLIQSIRKPIAIARRRVPLSYRWLFLAGLFLAWLLHYQAIVHEIVPPKLDFVVTRSARVNDIEYIYPIDSKLSLCWGAKLPCALAPIQKNIRLRDPQRGLDAGFVNLERSPSSQEEDIGE